jgi:hypothetical protein
MRRVAALTLVLLAPAAVPALASPSAPMSLVVTVTNSKLMLSRTTFPLGSLTVTVVNKSSGPGRILVGGKQTSLVAPGRRASLKLLLTRIGSYTLVSTGKQKRLQISFHVVSGSPGGATTPAPAPASSSGTTASMCAKPLATTVTASLDDGRYTFSQTTIPCGPVTFEVTNVGKLQHSLFLETQGGEGPTLSPGQTVRMVVNLPPGGVYYVDGVYEVDLGGAVGTLAIAG